MVMKKVYVFNIIGADMSSKLMKMASPSTVDFFVHNKVIAAGYTKCIWLDECEYIFPTDADVSSLGNMVRNICRDADEIPNPYEYFESHLADIGFEVEELTYESDILA